MRVVRMKLGDEFIELTEYLAPRGRAFPIDSRSNDRWFQHVAIIVSDMDKAYDCCGSTRSSMLPRDRNDCLIGTRTQAASRPSTSKIPTDTCSKSSSSLRARAIRNGSAKTNCSWELITRRLW